MFKALQLVYNAAATWERIDLEHPSILNVSLTFLAPWLILCYSLEGLCLVQFGQASGPIGQILPVPLPVVLRYELVTLGLTLALVYGGALLVSKVGESFHSRHSYQAGLTTLAFSISPLILVRLFDGCPVINTWICYTVGILLSVSLLYRGIPRTLRPEPSNALGMYLFISVFLIIATGLAHYVGTLILAEEILA